MPRFRKVNGQLLVLRYLVEISRHVMNNYGSIAYAGRVLALERGSASARAASIIARPMVGANARLVARRMVNTLFP